MVNKEFLLTSKQMAEFVNNGFLRFDELIPKHLCQNALKEMESRTLSAFDRQGLPFSEIWSNESSAIGKVFRTPEMEGIIHSLVGPNPRYDHHWPHLTKANSISGENLHQDAEYDPRFESFDIQISFFPSDVSIETGGTLFVPGSHFRRVHESSIRRYQNIVGQVQCVCKAGTIVVWHHNIWHSGRSNHTPADRFMFKLRLNPTVRQQLLWNTDDLHDESIPKIIGRPHKWQGMNTRVEEMNRIRLWRSLTNQSNFDLPGWFWTRIENSPNTSFDYSQGSFSMGKSSGAQY